MTRSEGRNPRTRFSSPPVEERAGKRRPFISLHSRSLPGSDKACLTVSLRRLLQNLLLGPLLCHLEVPGRGVILRIQPQNLLKFGDRFREATLFG